MKAKDVMATDLVTVKIGESIINAAQLFLEKGIGGLPVLSENQELRGILTKTDISVFMFDRELHALLSDDAGHMLVTPETKEAFSVEMCGDCVENVMTPNPVTAGPETHVRDLAQAMLERKIHRILIVENTRLVGLVSALDVLRYFAEKT